MITKIFVVLVLTVLYLVIPNPVNAHAFGQNYTLPLPIWLYLYGGSAAIIVSFFLIAFFSRNTKVDNQKNLFAIKIPSADIVKFSTVLIRLILLALFCIVLYAGLYGSQLATENIAPVSFWIIFLLGITYLSAILGNFWQSVNPLFHIISSLKFREKFKYPAKLAYFPALLFYFFLIWLELASNGLGINTKFISIMLTVYLALTFAGSYVFGYINWFNYADFFSLFFSMVSKISPIKVQKNKVSLNFGMPGEAKNISLLFFIMFALSSTAFDGFRQTKVWIQLFNWIEATFFSLFKYSPQTTTIETLALFLSPFLFLYLYMLAIIAMKQSVKTNYSIVSLSLKFAFTLIPIAVAYNVAHYFTLLLIQGQSFISQISDPFNLGWNLFGTVGYKINVGLISASTVWNTEVAVILLGHIAAVYFAHLKAKEIYTQNKKATLSQIPMLILMIIYTMTGLWILSQPLALKG